VVLLGSDSAVGWCGVVTVLKELFGTPCSICLLVCGDTLVAPFFALIGCEGDISGTPFLFLFVCGDFLDSAAWSGCDTFLVCRTWSALISGEGDVSGTPLSFLLDRGDLLG